ncbi:MAG: bifunctional 3,4-dihydroxy-2-butanone-4-phosphate synthase/GTP cyclohydrolase II [Bdellovibrionales bacterium]|nr:bifunctional 3,4-dihydroxy-2-butanone-4-phosphate synthase/GTP cyclohydrolase II [Bdellovibrionales bacterium]MBT3525783.1 bifunctional 3,4-dihydroxy-2-butanone-4-phosphate synthase/GTP cyclohydrolase II [Bdellovibrionales bacterium]MBT7668003.1 bifunctional 3,4-dihydroxy-2-butanone-4-phosphate synthase/GTP cyclohydrolase II [Bdellovibrionales bacterium]MBT7767596.1 bifunctional 3,4-dihydroxy-2-butanone-4-phosphate synthase/GTP cyclohydrolase II [Bdellovibrionales bacterium]
MFFDSIESVIEDIRAGKMVIVVDDEDRENEGDFLMAAECVTPDAINFMTKHGRGIVCAPVSQERADELNLTPMVSDNNSSHETAFTVSVDSINGTTGVSAHDRSETIKCLVSQETQPSDLVRPGHIFPLIAKDGGVLRRAGHTEAAIDLAQLAGFAPAGVICEIMDEDGSMARTPRLRELASKFEMKFVSIQDLIEYRRRNEILVEETSKIDFPNEYGEFKLHMFENITNPAEHHVAIVKGDFSPQKSVLVRVHSECLTGDIFGSKRCDCGDQLRRSMELIENEGEGVLLYMRQEGRGIGLPNKVKAYSFQDQGYDTVSANHKMGFDTDLREYGVGAQILKLLGVRKMRLMTNNPKKVVGLDAFDLEIVERVPIEIKPNEINLNYLLTKRDRMGHLILGDASNGAQ